MKKSFLKSSLKISVAGRNGTIKTAQNPTFYNVPGLALEVDFLRQCIISYVQEVFSWQKVRKDLSFGDGIDHNAT